MPIKSRGTDDAPTPASRIVVPAERAIVDCGVYVDGHRQNGILPYRMAIQRVRESGEGFVWIGVVNPDQRQMEHLAEAFGLHPLVIEDALGDLKRPKLEQYGDQVVMWTRTVGYVEHPSINQANEVVTTGGLLVVTGPQFVMTVRHSEIGELSGLRHSLEQKPEFLAKGPAAVLYSVLDHIVDNYIRVSAEIVDDVDELEDLVFGRDFNGDANTIYMLKREVLELKHDVSPLTIPLRRLVEDDYAVIDDSIRHYFRDILDHNVSVAEAVTAQDERLTSLVNAAIARVGWQQNSDMRMISAWVAILTIPMMLGGVYGMNFAHMPGLGSRFGFPVFVVVVLALCTGLWLFFRRRKWL